MINIEKLKGYCCEDISKIENYEQAVDDKTQTWDCHHRWEIFMMWRIPAKDLKDNGLYYHQPADRLIFLPHSEHLRLHVKGTKQSDETKRKLSEVRNGRKQSAEHIRKRVEANRGKKRTLEQRQRMSEVLKGRKFSDETKRKMSEAKRGKVLSEETKKKMSEARKRYLASRRAKQ